MSFYSKNAFENGLLLGIFWLQIYSRIFKYSLIDDKKVLYGT